MAIMVMVLIQIRRQRGEAVPVAQMMMMMMMLLLIMMRGMRSGVSVVVSHLTHRAVHRYRVFPVGDIAIDRVEPSLKNSKISATTR